MPADLLLDRLWSEIINLDPKGGWIDQAVRNSATFSLPFRNVPGILSRQLAAGASREDLGRIGRLDRYEACFGTLYALDDPGPGSRKLKALPALAEKAAPSKGRRATNDAFVSTLRALFETEEDDASIAYRIARCAERPDEPFADVGEALRRLKERGATPDELARLASWHRFEACRLTLRCAAETGVENPDELAGAHESLLGADPSGKDGRPGSWPLPKPKQPKARSNRSDPAKPFLSVKEEDSFEFTPDGTGIMIGNKIFDLDTGKLRLTLTVKGDLRLWCFSPDGTRSYHVVGTDTLVACDAESGRQLLKVQRRDLQGFVVHPQTGDLLIREMRMGGPGHTLLDFRTLQEKGKFDLTPGDSSADQLAFSSDGLRLAVFWAQGAGPRAPGRRVSIWRWPEATEEWEKLVPCWEPAGISWSTDSKRVAAGYNARPDEVIVFDGATGAEQLRLQPAKHHSFSHDGKYVVTGTHSGKNIQLWDAVTGQLRREIPLPRPWCFYLGISPDGKVLGVTSHRATHFWRFDALMAG